MDTDKSLKDISEVKKDIVGFSPYIEKISLKTERLTSALYMVTSLFDHDDPLKNRLRASAVEIMSIVSKSGSIGHYFNDKILSSIDNNISVIISCLEVSFNAGVCSSMNCEVLKREYDLLRQLIKSDSLEKGPSAMSIPTKFLYPSFDEIKSTKLSTLPPKEETINLMVSGDLSDPESRNVLDNPPVVYKGHNIKDNHVSKTSPLSSVSRISKGVAKFDRRSFIISLFKDKGQYTIKDILSKSALMGKKVEMSEKTIQRDLLSLVSEGVLNKSGERRWSKYFLNSISR